MKTNVQDAINEQIQAEFQSAYHYLAMSARFEEMNLRGAAQWMRVQWEEETVHAMKFYDFLIRRSGTPELMQLDAPETDFGTPMEAFEEVLKHEQYISKRIHDLYELAVKEHDYPLQTLLHWFIDEQVEEEENAQEIIDSLRLAGNTGQGLFLIDRELGQRQPGPEDTAA